MAPNELEALKIKLKSATRLKLIKEKELCQARNKERSLNEEITMLKSEHEYLKEQLEDVKSQISQTRHQISMIGICSTSEKCKMEAHFENLNHHQKGFQNIFNKEREMFEQRIKEIKAKEAEDEEMVRQKEILLAEQKELKAREAAKVDTECDALERECTVLKKRNNAVMLKLRRKLLETEKARRELAKKHTISSDKNT